MLLIAGLSPLMALVTQPSVWKLLMIVLLTAACCYPGLRVLRMARHPVSLSIAADGVRYRNAAETMVALQWSDIDVVSMSGLLGHDHGPRFLFVRRRRPGNESTYERLGSLFALNVRKHRISETLHYFAKSAWRPDYHMSTGVAAAERHVVLRGRSLSFHTVVACVVEAVGLMLFLSIITSDVRNSDAHGGFRSS
jgi:hypothetical protein